MVYLQFGNTPIYLTLFLNSLWSKIASIPVIRVILEIRDKKLKVDVDKLNLNGAILSNDKDRVDYGHIAYFDIEIKDSKDLRPDKIVSIIKETINEDFPIYKLAKEIAKMCILNDA